jgi:hypothetical protein
MKIRPPEKYLYFPTTFHSPFERAFEPSSCFFQARLRALVLSPFERAFEPSSYLLFERAFEPSTIKGSAFPILPPFKHVFEPLSYLHSSPLSSPCLISIRARLRALVLSPFRERLRALDH